MDTTGLCAPSHREHFLRQVGTVHRTASGAGGHAHPSLRLDAPQDAAEPPGGADARGRGPPTARRSPRSKVAHEEIVSCRCLLTF